MAGTSLCDVPCTSMSRRSTPPCAMASTSVRPSGSSAIFIGQSKPKLESATWSVSKFPSARCAATTLRSHHGRAQIVVTAPQVRPGTPGPLTTSSPVLNARRHAASAPTEVERVTWRPRQAVDRHSVLEGVAGLQGAGRRLAPWRLLRLPHPAGDAGAAARTLGPLPPFGHAASPGRALCAGRHAQQAGAGLGGLVGVWRSAWPPGRKASPGGPVAAPGHKGDAHARTQPSSLFISADR